MRVVVTAESYLPYVSGVTVSTEALVRGLVDRGHAVLLVAPRPAPRAEISAVVGTGGRVARSAMPGTLGEPTYAWLASYQLPRMAPRSYRMPWPLPWSRVVAAALDFGPDIVHAQSPFVSGMLALRIARRAGAPLVFTHHTRFADYRHYLGPLARPGAAVTSAFIRAFWGRCAAVIVPSTDLAAEILADLGPRSRTRVETIPTGIDTTAIAALEPIDVRPAAGWPSDSLVVATLGRLAREKRVDVILEAVAVAAAQAPRLRVVVIGDGPTAAVLRRRSSAPELVGRVWFTGALPRSEALAHLRGADLFAFASDTETQGLVLAEALAAGLPVVALGGPGVADSVRDGVDGVIVPRPMGGVAQARALGKALVQMAHDDQRSRAMAGRAIGDAGRFDIGLRLTQLERLYVNLVNERS
jgi:glycosyltransferase involved in cell wall biosynthesis